MDDMQVNGMPIGEKTNDLNSLLPDIGLEVQDSCVFRWKIESWTALKGQKKSYSPEFSCFGTRWRILIFPNGNQQNDTLSVFLDSVEAATIPKNSNWHICVHFALAITNPNNDTIFKASTAQHRYNPNEADWGFNHLVKLSQLFTPVEPFTRPFIENDQTVIVVHMKIIKDVTGVLWHTFANYDSRKETGYIGLKNQGATCYMNSVLQSLYFTSYFRKATFAIPTDDDEPTKSIALALQRVFYQLQMSEVPVGTTELTKSFGWDTLDAFMQHDVQEFNRVLQDNLESKMKGTRAEGAVSKLFLGKYKSFIKCLNVDFESSRIEDFYDVQLNVKGLQNLRDSFVDYVASETLDGENMYHAEGFGLQAARKGVVFTEFPPVLHLQLKRFEYDMDRDAMVKINDRYVFPTEIDLQEFLESPSAKRQNYVLHGVLVHTGDVHGGHYCAFLKPEKNGKWFKFDDDRVVPVTMKEVLDDNFGGDAPNPKTGVKSAKRFTNAYMLVYIRETDLDEILCPITQDDIPEHLRRRFEQERMMVEQRRREKEEQHLYLNCKVLVDDLIKDHQGFDLCNFDDKTMPLTPVPVYKMKKEDTLSTLRTTLAEKYAIEAERIRLWTMIGRQNRTIRPDCPLTESLMDKTFEFIRDRYSKNSLDLRLYAEFLPDAYSHTCAEKAAQNAIVIFLKYYDPFTARIHFVGNIQITNKSQRLWEIFPLLCERANLAKGTQLLLFEEVKPEMIDLLKPKATFTGAELGDGDIICYQRDLSSSEIEKLPDPEVATVQKYFDLLRNRQVVVFKPKLRDSEPITLRESCDIQLTLSKKMPYDLVIAKLADRLNADPNKIRLSTNATIASRQIIKKTPTLTLQDMLQAGFYNPLSTPSVLYYEVLEVNIAELEIKRYLRITFVDAQMQEHPPFTVLIMKNARASELIHLCQEKVKSIATSGDLRLMEASGFRISKHFAEDDLVSTISDSAMLYLEEIPLEDLKRVDGDKYINVYHFNKDPARGHGVPFRFILRKGETFDVTRQRLLQRAGLQDKDAERIKIFFVPGGYMEATSIADDEILTDRSFTNDDYLGIDHRPTKPKTSQVVEKSIKIHN
ncbi:hypothetical protein HDU76_007055 [Blyttiomyces sp. JEL0837]|nr:hypothetical protein HDU76_007055 [Blyttiomyces sp. JEL0837]